MKLVLAGLVAAALGAGCMVRVPVATARPAVKAERCPPGHQWSDGRCHDRGRGHDRGK